MRILVIAEHDNKSLKSCSLPVVTAASELGGEIDMLIAGHNAADAAAQAAKISGVKRILHCDAPLYEHGLAENLAQLVASLSADYSHILAPASFFGKNVTPRIAALLDRQQISDITAIHDAKSFTRPIYAGNAFETVEISETPVILTVRPTAFDATPEQAESAAITALPPAEDTDLSAFVSRALTKSDRPDLANAAIVISGGRGLGSGENFKDLLEPLADSLGAAIGASRAAVDAGYVPNDYQVGQTGKIVAPNLYIAVGISGAVQHLAGMKDSKIIVAINKDEDAPIFQIADYGLVGDLFQLLPELRAALDNSA